MDNTLNELKLEPLEPLEPQESKVSQVGARRWNFRQFILTAGVVLVIILAVWIFLPSASEPEKLAAQVFQFGVVPAPNQTAMDVSISNREDDQTIIVQLYPVYLGKEHSGIYARSIDGSRIEGTTLPIVLRPGEVRVLKILFTAEKTDLDEYADKLKDSSLITLFKDGPLPGQLHGYIGLGWRVMDAEGENYMNVKRLAYYVLKPAPPGSLDPTYLDYSSILSEEPFELCTNGRIVN